jgi:hypothetical protein
MVAALNPSSQLCCTNKQLPPSLTLNTAGAEGCEVSTAGVGVEVVEEVGDVLSLLLRTVIALLTALCAREKKTF